MLSLSRTTLLSLIQSTTHDEVPKIVVDYWFTVYGKEIPQDEGAQLAKEEIKF